MSKSYRVEFPPAIMARGFWLYIWNIVAPTGERLCYVGMTGDVSGVAQSPFNRAGAHLGSNKNANAIKRHLASHGLEAEQCASISFLVHGPILPYFRSSPRHEDFDKSRKAVGALERRLWEEMQAAGYVMLNNRPRFPSDFDGALWATIWPSFRAALSEN